MQYKLLTFVDIKKYIDERLKAIKNRKNCRRIGGTRVFDRRNEREQKRTSAFVGGGKAVKSWCKKTFLLKTE